MEVPPQEGSPSGSKRHSRHASYNRGSQTPCPLELYIPNYFVYLSSAPLARHPTKGPLDPDDPPAVEDPLLQHPFTAQAANIPIPTTPLSPERPPTKPVTVSPSSPPSSSKDYSYLLRPEIYHPLSQLELPPPFRTPNHQPPPTTSLPTLLETHAYRAAAIFAANRLTTPPSPPPAEIFSLLYIRLACLTLINHLAFAAQEAKALEDVNSSFYRDEESGKHVLPWELRVLIVRLHGIGFADGRRGVGGYYELAREARMEAKKTKDEEKRLWKDRLKELGLCVANVLVEMGDLGAAAKHLESLRSKDDAENAILDARLALVYLRRGDVDTAKRLLTHHTTSSQSSPLHPLLTIACGNYALAIDEYRTLPPSDVATQNLAVCLFYTGKMNEAIELLDELVEKGRSFHALLFNMSTYYELTSERGVVKKGELVERVARGLEGGGGGERGMDDFKL